MNEVINGIRYGKMEEFHNKYRKNCDVLLMDDIQLIAGKDRTQEEFFHTFNTLHEMKKQIVVSSDKLPHEIPGLEERMRTRFQWGLIADIQPPEIETRVAILKKKAEAENVDLPDDVAMFLAENIRSNVRELEGALIRVVAHSSLTGQRISIDYAKQVLAELLAGRRNQVTVESIQKMVATFYNVKIADLKSQRRHKIVARPRQVAMYLCRKLLNASYPELGDRFGGKDHTTILSACRKMESLSTKDNQLRTELLELQRKIQDS
jgi:chromosomal replication initiator protein